MHAEGALEALAERGGERLAARDAGPPVAIQAQAPGALLVGEQPAVDG